MSSPERGTRSTTRGLDGGRWPSRARWTDLAFLVALLGVALSGWATTFTGSGFWWVAMIGVVVSVLCTVLARGIGLPAAAAVLLVVAVYFLLGGPMTLRSRGDTALLPWISASELVDQVLFGWKDLLTTLPPVDGAGPLLVLPWTVGMLGGVLGALLVLVPRRRSWRTVVLPVLLSVAVLALVVGLGVARPHSLLWQGGGFGLLALAWLAVANADAHGGAAPAARRTRPSAVRLIGGAAMLAVAAGAAVPLTSAAMGDDHRVVARDHVDPPFDIGRYPSPLAAFRNYVDLKGRAGDANVYADELFRVDGLAAGDRVRFAALDHWDGMVYGATNDALGAETGDSFQRVSSQIDNPVEGRRVEVRVTLREGYRGVWLPTAGALQGLRFRQGDVRDKEESFRYNLATSSAVVPSGLYPGDSYTFEAVLPDDSLTPETTPSPEFGQSNADTTFLNRKLEDWTAAADGGMARVYAVADTLKREGRYSDGVRRAERAYYPGHGLKRLSDGFINAQTMVGNDEQYAAAMALLADRVGVPARVVLGAVVPPDGVVRGEHVEAWVELRAADGSWRTLPTEQFMSRRPPSEQAPQTQEPMTGTVVPPPAPIPPPSDVGEPSDSDLRARMEGEDAADDDEDAGGFSLPGWVRALLLYLGLPLLLVGLVLGSVVGAKAIRRWRRRTADSGPARVAGAWRELVDHARDLGQPVPAGRAVTRREQSQLITVSEASSLARRADAGVFGPEPATEQEAEHFWDEVAARRRELRGQVDPWRRMRAAVSLASFGTADRRRDWRIPGISR